MAWYTRTARTKLILFAVAILIALLIAVRSPAQQSAAMDVYRSPRLTHLGSLGCDITESHAADPAACQVLKSGRGGWVVLDLMVDAEGKPFEISVSRSTGFEALDALAVRAMSASTFEPGSVNGKPTEAAFEFEYVLWEGPFERAIGRAFNSQYDALRHALAKDDRAAADAAMKKMVITNLSEDALFGMASYFYAKQWGDETQQLEGLQRAIAHEGNPIKGGGTVHSLFRWYFNLALQVSMELQLKLHLYAEALQTYRRLQGTDLDSATLAQFKTAVAQLQKIRTDDSWYSVAADMPRGTWSLSLFKRHFRAEVAAGSISQVKLRCQGRYVSFAFDPNLQYDLAPDSGNCGIEMLGAPGTRFKLIQY